MFQLITQRIEEIVKNYAFSAVYLCRGFCEGCIIRFECYTHGKGILITEKSIKKVRKKKLPYSMWGNDVDEISCEEHNCSWCIISDVCADDDAETTHKKIQENGGSIRRKKMDTSWFSKG